MKKNILFLTILTFLINSNSAVKADELIQDEFINKQFAGVTLTKPTPNLSVIEDYDVKADYKGIELQKPVSKLRNTIDDNLQPIFVNNEVMYKPQYVPKILSEDVVKPINVCIVPVSTTKTRNINILDKDFYHKGAEVGEKVHFLVKNDVYKNGKIFIAKNTVVNAIVGNVEAASSGGAPAILTIERFTTKDVDGNRVTLSGEINKSGWNYTPIVYLLAYGGYPYTFGASKAILYMPGGQAKIKPHQKFNVYYEAP